MVPDHLFTNMSTAEWVLNFAIHSLVVLSAGWLILALFKQKSAALRSKIGFVTMLALLLLPFFSAAYQSFDIAFYKTSLPFKGDSRLSEYELSNDEISLVGTLQDRPEIRSDQAKASTPKRSKISIFLASVLSRITTVNLINGVGVIWLVGFLLFLGRLLYGAGTLVRFKKGLTRIKDKRLNNILRQAQKTFAFKSPPEIYTSESVKSPMALGIIRPLVVFPERFYNELSSSEIKAVLFHELSHIYHRDQATGVLQRIVTALYWWNPMVHALSTDFSKTREEISDNHAIMENSSREYAECLVNLAEKATSVQWLPFSQGLAVPHLPMKKRISQILSKERIMATETKKSTTLIILLVFILSIGLIAGHKWTFASDKQDIHLELGQEIEADFQVGMAIDQEKEQEQKKEEEQEQEQEEEKEQEIVEELKQEQQEEQEQEIVEEQEQEQEKEKEQEKEQEQEKEKEHKKKHEIVHVQVVPGKEIEKEKKHEKVYIKILPEQEKEEIEKKLQELKAKLCAINLELFPVQLVLKVDKDGDKLILVKDVCLPIELNEELKELLKELKATMWTLKVDGKKIHVDVGVESALAQNKTLTEEQKEKIREKLKQLKLKMEKVHLDVDPHVSFVVKSDYKIGKKYENVSVQVKPKLAMKIKPEFPEEAEKKGIYGEVVVKGTTDDKGNVVKVEVIKGAHELLNEAVVNAVKQWKYELPEHKGKTYAITFTVTVHFNIDDKDKETEVQYVTVKIDK